MIIPVTEIGKIEIVQGGLQIRLSLLVKNGDAILSEQFHRTSMEFGGAGVQAQMDLVNQHIGQMGWPPVPQSDIDRISQFYDLAMGMQS